MAELMDGAAQKLEQTIRATQPKIKQRSGQLSLVNALFWCGVYVDASTTLPSVLCSPCWRSSLLVSC